MKYVIIGAGWYGCHLACELAKDGYQVTLLDKNKDILSETSGNFGVRLHRGPHYQNSVETRLGCHRGFDEFRRAYPELLVEHQASIYAHGLLDAKGFPSKVSRKHFDKVCQENDICHPVDLEAAGYQNVDSAFSLDESSIVVGEALRAYFRTKLHAYNVDLQLSVKVDKVLRTTGHMQVKQGDYEIDCDAVINTTGFQFNPSETSPLRMEVVYQPCIALKVRDKNPQAKATSFIVMDGWFPCLMPYVEERTPLINNYILTHGCWTILDSCDTPQKANEQLKSLYENDELVTSEIMPRVYAEMERFMPGFSKRFEYTSWTGGVVAKIRNQHEFRGAVTFRDEIGMIQVIPGKIQNVFDVKREVDALEKSRIFAQNKNTLSTNIFTSVPARRSVAIQENGVVEFKGVAWVADGVLHKALHEISAPPKSPERNTCYLKTIVDIEKMQKAYSSPNLLELQNPLPVERKLTYEDEKKEVRHRPLSAPDKRNFAYKSGGFFVIAIPRVLFNEMKQDQALLELRSISRNGRRF